VPGLVVYLPGLHVMMTEEDEARTSSDSALGARASFGCLTMPNGRPCHAQPEVTAKCMTCASLAEIMRRRTAWDKEPGSEGMVAQLK